ncbi:MAG: 50S ribosomal protein L24 [Proteobacteria bacterium]|nr:MAG: 50S ribosomal protein L24 [Pseudomonadota bacterium]
MTKEQKVKSAGKTGLRKGDMVMVIAGGHKKKRPIKGKTGKIMRFVGTTRAIVEGLNFVTRHKRASGPGQQSSKVQMEAPIDVSRLMFYAEKIQKPVRLKHKFLADGSKVRGYLDPKSREFVQL